LDLSTLPYGSSPFPGCVASVFGTGHTILLTYTASGTASALPSPPTPVGSTVPGSAALPAPAPGGFALSNAWLPSLVAAASAGAGASLAAFAMAVRDGPDP